MANPPTIRRRNFLTLKQKVELIMYKQNNPSVKRKTLGELFSCGKTQVSTILRDKDSLLKIYRENTRAHSAKNFRASTYGAINNILYEWFMDQVSEKVYPTGPCIIRKAKDLARTLGKPEFKGSQGWLCKWKTRYNIPVATNRVKKTTSKNTHENSVPDQYAVREDSLHTSVNSLNEEKQCAIQSSDYLMNRTNSQEDPHVNMVHGHIDAQYNSMGKDALDLLETSDSDSDLPNTPLQEQSDDEQSPSKICSIPDAIGALEDVNQFLITRGQIEAFDVVCSAIHMLTELNSQD